LTDQEKETLIKLVAKHKTSQAKALVVVYNTVLKWMKRWWENHSEKDVEERLEDLWGICKFRSDSG